ncbi:hypothetical protein ACVDG5_017240 [Mesorhizobium sp. ORM6]
MHAVLQPFQGCFAACFCPASQAKQLLLMFAKKGVDRARGNRARRFVSAEPLKMPPAPAKTVAALPQFLGLDDPFPTAIDSFWEAVQSDQVLGFEVAKAIFGDFP